MVNFLSTASDVVSSIEEWEGNHELGAGGCVKVGYKFIVNMEMMSLDRNRKDKQTDKMSAVVFKGLKTV